MIISLASSRTPASGPPAAVCTARITVATPTSTAATANWRQKRAAARLVATAAGLAVAIPAVIAYNWFLSQVKVLNDDMRNFTTELVNVIVRDYRLR